MTSGARRKVRTPHLGIGASAVNSFLSWFLNIVLGDDFVLMVTMFTLVGVAEYYFPA